MLKKTQEIEKLESEVRRLTSQKSQKVKDDDQKLVVLQGQFSNLENDYKRLLEENKELKDKIAGMEKVNDILRKKNVLINEILNFIIKLTVDDAGSEHESQENEGINLLIFEKEMIYIYIYNFNIT